MKNLLDNIIDELESVGIELLEEDLVDSGYYEVSYNKADRNKLREALSKAITKSMMD